MAQLQINSHCVDVHSDTSILHTLCRFKIEIDVLGLFVFLQGNCSVPEKGDETILRCFLDDLLKCANKLFSRQGVYSPKL